MLATIQGSSERGVDYRSSHMGGVLARWARARHIFLTIPHPCLCLPPLTKQSGVLLAVSKSLARPLHPVYDDDFPLIFPQFPPFFAFFVPVLGTRCCLITDILMLLSHWGYPHYGDPEKAGLM